MKAIELSYPDALNLSPEAFAREAKLALAVKLFELGWLTSGQAAELAGVGRAQFLLVCSRFGASSPTMGARGRSGRWAYPSPAPERATLPP